MREPDDHWLLLRERGDDISYVPANTRARYEQLAELIQELPGEAPRPGWKAQILAAIDALPVEERAALRPERRHPAWLNMVGLAVAASCAVAIAWCNVVTDRHPRVEDRSVSTVASAQRGEVERMTLSTDTRFTTEIRRGAPMRGEHRVLGVITAASEGETAVRRETAHVGDTLILHVAADPALELRVYGDAGEPLARCADLLDCSLEATDRIPRFRLEVSLRSPGHVTAVLFARSSMPTPFQDLNADLEAAYRAKRETRRVALVLVN
jgi:hypothetical protein